MARKETHVVPCPTGGWNVKREHARRISLHADTKVRAVSAARVISRNRGSELVIHARSGQIMQSDSHGRDPHPPRG